MATLAEVLEQRTAEAAPELVESISNNRLRCYACGHECPIPEGAVGVENSYAVGSDGVEQLTSAPEELLEIS